MKRFEILYTDAAIDFELSMVIVAKDLDDAAEWAEKTLEDAGYEVTKIRPVN